jgi:hypothetical protein
MALNEVQTRSQGRIFVLDPTDLQLILQQQLLGSQYYFSITKPATGHDRVPVLSTSGNTNPKDPS